VAVLAAGLLLVEVNALSARKYFRVDLSESGRFTLSPQTEHLLRGLEESIDVTIVLSAGDGLAIDLRHTLDAYQASSPYIHVRFVDPDRDPAEFLSLAAKHPLLLGEDETGQIQPTVALMVERAGRHHYVKRTDISSATSDGSQQLNIEGALSEAILKVSSKEETIACFTSGHGERSPEDLGPEGLMELDHQALRINLTPRRVDLTANADIGGCDIFLVVGPKRPFSAEAEERLQKAGDAGADFLLLLDPIVDGRGELAATSLEGLSERFGIHQTGGFVLEGAPDRRLPQGIGEVFVAEPEPHPVTSTLQTDGYRSQTHFVASATQGFVLSGAAAPLLKTSDRAELIRNLSEVSEADQEKEQFVIAAVSQMGDSTRRSKMVVFGFSSLAETETLRDPTLPGNRDVLLAALAWLAESPAELGIAPDKPRTTALPLTEDSLAAMLRYVLLYMPLTCALLGVFVHLLRRRREQRFLNSVSKPATGKETDS
jgi:hypothetical protein